MDSGAGSFWRGAAIAVLACVALAIVIAPDAAEAGLTGQAKGATKQRIQASDARPVKISCRIVGKKGRDGAKCKWVYAKLTGRGATKNCKGESQLRTAKSGLKFKIGACKKDKGATSVNGLLPAQLAKRGLDSTFVFCFTTLGNGYSCLWEALRYRTTAVEDCKGTGRTANRKISISIKGCSANTVATRAQASVKAALKKLGLKPGHLSCKPGSPIKCTYQASVDSGGWTYSCSGGAKAPGPAGPFSVDRCKLHAPDLAPIRRAGPHPNFGVNDIWPFFISDLGKLSDLGANSARFTVNWAGVESAPNLPPNSRYNWTQPDSVYRPMIRQGIRPILILQAAPCWATGEASCKKGDFTYPPDDAHLDEWADFAAAVARRYPDALALEVWNEANADLFFRGAPQPIKYGKMLRAAYPAVKAVAPKMPVLTTGLAPYATNRPGQRQFDKFLRDIYKQGAADYSDGIAHHAYPGSGPSGYLRSVRTQIADLKDVMLAFGDQNKPIWITETGASNTSDKPYTEAQQAKTVPDIYTLFRRIPGVPTVIVHRWEDERPGNAAESGFGLFRSNGSRKPVYCELAKARLGSYPRSC